MIKWLLRKIPQYSDIEGFLHRWALLTVGRFRIRIHNIRAVDVTPFLHSHPFHYVSVVLSGGYTEQVLVDAEVVVNTFTRGKIINGSPKKFHKITSCLPNTYTLFFAWYIDRPWELVTHPMIVADPTYVDMPDGIYLHNGGFRKRSQRRWYVACKTIDQARSSVKLTIYQQITIDSVKLYENL